jgi:glycosyltransferase involved in cell wall biosynthesis
MPVYNSSKYISESIESVINQIFKNWELIIIDDGSNDSTDEVVSQYMDTRIRYFKQSHGGVSSARNFALEKMKGDYFCFLDADDVMPSNGLRDRIGVFENQPDLTFVDGTVIYFDVSMKRTGKKYIPSFEGYPYDELLRLNRTCYFGNTWMIKKEMNVDYQFSEEMTHAEDLFFYLTISKDRKYSYTTNPVLFYRERKNSAMKDLAGLEKGYLDLLRKVKQELQPDTTTFKVLKKRVMRVMFLSHLFDGRNPFSAARSGFRFLTKV